MPVVETCPLVGLLKEPQETTESTNTTHTKQAHNNYVLVQVGGFSTEPLHMVTPQLLVSVPLNVYPVIQL